MSIHDAHGYTELEAQTAGLPLHHDGPHRRMSLALTGET